MKQSPVLLAVLIIIIFGAPSGLLSFLAYRQVGDDYVRLSEIIANSLQTFAVLCILVALILQYMQTRIAQEHKFAEVFFQLLDRHRKYLEGLGKNYFKSVYDELKSKVGNSLAEEDVWEVYKGIIEEKAELKAYYRSLSYLLKLIITSGLDAEEKSYYKNQIRLHQSNYEQILMYYDRHFKETGGTKTFEEKLKSLAFFKVADIGKLKKLHLHKND